MVEPRPENFFRDSAMRISSNNAMMKAIFLVGMITLYAGMMPHAQADPLEFLIGADREKLSLGSNSEYFGSQLNSKLSGLSFKGAISIAKDGVSPLFEDTGKVNIIKIDPPLAIESIAIGAQHQLNDQWAVSANLAWIKSELYDGLIQKAPPDIIVPVVWDETTRYILGVCFTPADRWAVRAKVFLDQPLDKPFIDFSYGKDHPVFDQGRLWLAATVDYHIRNDLSFDLEYARVSLKEGGQRTKGVADDASETENAVAERRTSIDLFSASLTIQF